MGITFLFFIVREIKCFILQLKLQLMPAWHVPVDILTIKQNLDFYKGTTKEPLHLYLV